jgi:hypothetical protein
MTAAVCVGGLLIPGLGHFLLKRWGRGALLLISIVLMFWIGLGMHGQLHLLSAPLTHVSGIPGGNSGAL